MNRKVILFLIIIVVLAGASYFYLVQITSPGGQNSLQKSDNQAGTPKAVELDETIFKNLETNIITVVFSDDTTKPQAREILTSLGLNDSTLDYIFPRKDINVTIKNLTSKKAFSTCRQLLAIEKVILCTPLPLLY